MEGKESDSKVGLKFKSLCKVANINNPFGFNMIRMDI
jgi:hypothetical protein